MPPRYTYWTIILDGQPTAFRARERDDLEPTLRQLRARNPTAALKWFAHDRLWESPDEARRARDARSHAAGERRDRDWRPGGDHKDRRLEFRRKQQEERQRRKAERERPRGPRPPRFGDGKPSDQPPGGNRPPWQRDSRGAQGGAGRQPWNRERPWSNRPGSDRPQGDRPRSDRPHTDRPWRDRPRESRPPAGDRPDRPRDRKPPGGHRPPWQRDSRGAQGGAGRKPWNRERPPEAETIRRPGERPLPADVPPAPPTPPPAAVPRKRLRAPGPGTGGAKPPRKP